MALPCGCDDKPSVSITGSVEDETEVREECGTVDQDLNSVAKFFTVAVSCGSVDKIFYLFAVFCFIFLQAPSS
jgi:hypothetical protein